MWRVKTNCIIFCLFSSEITSMIIIIIIYFRIIKDITARTKNGMTDLNVILDLKI